MKRTGVVFILILAFFGIADSAYLAEHSDSGIPLICDIKNLSGCNIVASSQYSYIFGIPISELGVIFYSIMFALTALELIIFDRLLRRALQVFALIGVAVSIFSTVVQVFIIKALCIYCLASTLITFIIFILASIIEPINGIIRRNSHLILFIAFLLPTAVVAAPTSFSAANSLFTASSSPGNAYLAGASVVVTMPVIGDLSAFGGTVVTAARISGDELIIAGSANSRAQVFGDLRAIGGRVKIEGPVSGDLVAAGFSVHDSGRAGGSVFIIAANATLANGAAGPVTIYGNNILLAGNFENDIDIIASGRITMAASTTIAGKFSYEAPEPAVIPSSVTIAGGVKYTNASYLPDIGTSRILAFISVGFFIFVRILGALILAGLLAGLFPGLAKAISERMHAKYLRDILLTTLLGFAILVATPVLFIMLLLTFVGIGLALLLVVLYALLVLLALLYSGILLGSVLARRYAKRDTVLWHDGVLGMLALSLITLVPFIGIPIVFFLTAFSAGALLIIFFNFAFSGE